MRIVALPAVLLTAFLLTATGAPAQDSEPRFPQPAFTSGYTQPETSTPGPRTFEMEYVDLADSDSQWQYWHLYFGDERCLPSGHPERNSRMVYEGLSGKVPIPAAQVHPIRAELGAEAAASDYQRLLQTALPFQMVLLGLGEDGHTASLFPGQQHPGDELVLPVHDAPKPPPDRVSLSARALADTENLLFLVTGEGKRDAVRRWRANEPIPANTITTMGRAEVLIDQAAWPE